MSCHVMSNDVMSCHVIVEDAKFGMTEVNLAPVEFDVYSIKSEASVVFSIKTMRVSVYMYICVPPEASDHLVLCYSHC